MDPQNNGYAKPDWSLDQQVDTTGTGSPPDQLPSVPINPVGQVTPQPPQPLSTNGLRTMGQPAPGWPSIANNTDLIEDEWIHAIKRIMQQHQGDPYSQTIAMTNLRADYMKKRYNKVIKKDSES